MGGSNSLSCKHSTRTQGTESSSGPCSACSAPPVANTRPEHRVLKVAHRYQMVARLGRCKHSTRTQGTERRKRARQNRRRHPVANTRPEHRVLKATHGHRAASTTSRCKHSTRTQGTESSFTSSRKDCGSVANTRPEHRVLKVGCRLCWLPGP